MNIEELRNYCLSKTHTSESFPFDQSTLVFKVADKMFALTNIDKLPYSVNLKCNPDIAIELREQYAAVKAGYHMSKKHWNTITISEDMSTQELKKWIDHSYDLVIKSMTKKKQKELGLL